MKEWILSVCGVALLAFLGEIILPEGSTKKYCSSVMAVVVTFSMLLPIVKFANNGFSVNADMNDKMENATQVNTRNILTSNLEQIFEEQNLHCQRVEVDVTERKVFVYFSEKKSQQELDMIKKAVATYLPTYTVEIIEIQQKYG